MVPTTRAEAGERRWPQDQHQRERVHTNRRGTPTTDQDGVEFS
jgi:hypothetical protein